MNTKRLLATALAGLAIAALGYYAAYSVGTARCRSMCQSPAPDLAWLKQEFHLGDAEFQRVVALHEAYRPACQDRCRLIDAKNAELRARLLQTGAVTPEVDRALAEAAGLRRNCQTAMLKHFVEVSRAMPPAQGRRYLEWICGQTLSPAHAAMMAGAGSVHVHEPAGH